MLSAGISKMGKTSLYFIERGVKIDSDCYQELLDLMLSECYEIDGGKFIFQQDGARSHTSASTIEYLDDHDVNFEYIPPNKWPANSPDLNPCDNSLWNDLEQALHRRNRLFETVEEMKTHLAEVWDALPQEHSNNAIDAFRQKCKLVIQAEGRHIEHYR